MQQRRLRLGDILDDYCPRERRITNHAVVAMIDDEVKQTRCTTCDADHEYKEARIPPQRRKKSNSGLVEPAESALRPRPDEEGAALNAAPETESGESFEAPTPSFETPTEPDMAEPEPGIAAAAEEEGPVHRRLIRATLPRPEGQMPDRKAPDFTIRQPGMRGRDFDGHKNDNRHGRRPMRAQGGAQSRFGGPRQQGPGGSRPGPGGQPHRPSGNRPGHPGGPRGNRPGSGPGRGGRKRGR